MINRRIKLNNKGAALLITFILMITLVVIAGGYLFMVSRETRNVGYQMKDMDAFFLAEAGIHKAAWYLNNTAPDGSADGSWRTTGYSENLGDGSYTMVVEDFVDVDFTSYIRITSTGTVGDLSRTVRQKAYELRLVANTWEEL